MVFEQIENLKRQYTDQFVVVDDNRPELARFRGVTGQVKTINMNGRALVEFQDYIANIGWYDIELDFLTVVPKPDPEAVKAAAKPAAKPAAAKPAAAAAAAKPAAVKAKPAAAKPAAGKASTADILAAARAKKAASEKAAVAAVPSDTDPLEDEPEPASTPEGTGKSAIETPVVKKPPAKSTAAVPPIGTPMSTAQKIAVCRQIDAKKS